MNSKKIVTHILIWIALAGLRLLHSIETVSANEAIISTGTIYLFNAAIFYSGAWIYQFFNTRKNYILMILILIALVILSSISLRVISGLLEFFLDIPVPDKVVKYGITRNSFIILISLVFQVNENKKKAEQRTKTIEIQKNETELRFLKNQMNPHFFFNTLNNIYGLSFQKDDLAPKAILKLSEAMRYVIYETGKDFVPLQHEIRFLNNYLELERLRLSNKENLKIHIDIQNHDLKIAPLILLNFIENSFKHSNISESTDSFIEINLWQENNRLNFSCSNTYNSTGAKKHGGVGLQNTEKRLQLIYKEDFDLKFGSEGAKYFVFLDIPLYS